MCLFFIVLITAEILLLCDFLKMSIFFSQQTLILDEGNAYFQ